METDFFSGALFSLNFEQLDALLPYLWLSVGIGLSVFAAGYRFSNTVIRTTVAAVLIPFIGLLVRNMNQAPQNIFDTSLEFDALSKACGIGVALLGLMASVFSKSDEKNEHPEWAPLLLISILGLAMLPAARDWGAFFIYLEMASIPGYILAAINTRKSSSLEAGLKYLLMGAFSTAIFLLGVAFYYGLTGDLNFSSLAAVTENLSGANLTVAAAAGIFIFSGLGFKVALVPFHMWAPDVYQGAPTGIASYLASATKLSVFCAMLVSFQHTQLWSIEYVRHVALVLGALTIVVGSLLAWSQKQLRRMFAYSSIVNAGYISVAVVLGSRAAPSVFLYLLVYGLTVIGIFSLIENFLRILGKDPNSDLEISDLALVAKKAPKMLTVFFVLGVFSLTGIPPFPGFFTKYLVLRDLWENGQYLGSYAIILGTLLGLGYYLRCFIPIFSEKTNQADDRKESLAFSALLASCLCVLVLGILLLGMNNFLSWTTHVEGWTR